MPRIEVLSRVPPAIAIAAMLAFIPTVAIADTRKTGGTSAPTRPVIAELQCSQDPMRCAPGDTLTLRGEGFSDARVVTFLGRRGHRDDRRVRPEVREDHVLTVRVPSRARSGTVRVSAAAGSARSNHRVIIDRNVANTPGAETAADRLYVGGIAAVFRYQSPPVAAGQAFVEAFRVTDGVGVASWPVQPAANGAGQVAWDGTVSGVAVAAGRYAFRVTGPAQATVAVDGSQPQAFDVLDAIFPIRGKHDFGQTATNNFGGGRGHQGQDVFAACGTRLVAARGGTVTVAEYDGRGGNYVVITGPDQQSYVYMHMRRPSPLRPGQPVVTGQPVGEVGETGRADGCHLHFELWTAPGWRTGGTAIDPLPELRRWDAFS